VVLIHKFQLMHEELIRKYQWIDEMIDNTLKGTWFELVME